MSTATIDHPGPAAVLAPAVQLVVTAALAAGFTVTPTQQGRRVVDAVSGWASGLLAPGLRSLVMLLVGTCLVLGLVVVVVVGVLRERLWAVVYTLEEGVALALLVGVYGWVLANSAVVFLVVVAVQGAATTVRHRRA